ncbi:MAG: hypothetical protein H0V72_14890 [Bradyrhizobium sp.]|nr:hypothetical protein [Bradyrhizobium sp.]
MIHNWWTPKGFACLAAMASLACVAVVVAIGLVYPKPVPSAALGPDWQCSRLAYVWTTCTRLKHAQAIAVRVASESPSARRES